MSYGVFGLGLFGFAGEAHEERERGESCDGHGEDEEGVLVTEHGGLAEELLVGDADGALLAADAALMPCWRMTAATAAM